LSGAANPFAAGAGLPPEGNRVLAALPRAQFKRLRSELEPVSLLVGDVLCESGVPATHAIFPAHSIVSLQHVTEGGASVEYASVGNEGMVGFGLALGGEEKLSRWVVQAGGLAWRLRADVLAAEFERGEALFRLVLQYTQALVSQVALTAACNRRHTLEQQLCRWFLLALDRLPGDELVITQELIASILGVRREGVTEAAGRLQRAGIIESRRGHITVLRRDGLGARACECYPAMRAEIDRLVPRPSAPG
jgi:CRP-like cAMP-binding protein